MCEWAPLNDSHLVQQSCMQWLKGLGRTFMHTSKRTNTHTIHRLCMSFYSHLPHFELVFYYFAAFFSVYPTIDNKQRNNFATFIHVRCNKSNLFAHRRHLTGAIFSFFGIFYQFSIRPQFLFSECRFAKCIYTH